MKIILTKTGGVAGVQMQAIINYTLTNEAWDELINAVEKKGAKKIKDAFNYALQIAGNEKSRVVIDPALTPAKYDTLMQQLFNNLLPVKN
jgi:hypothetical protein